MPAVAGPTLAQIAEGLETRARALWDEGKREAAWEVMGEVVKLLKAWGTMKGLPKSTLTDTLRGEMEATHRGSISKAHLDHPMMDAARKAGYQSLGDLAEALGYDADSGKSFLSRVFKGKKSMPSDKAAKFRELTGKSWKL
jgi:hypothetical protein